MSGIALIARRDGRPVSSAAAAGVMARLSHRALDGEGAVELGWAFLGHAHFWTTPEEVGELQPLSLRSQGRHFAFDGRLDNRAELAEALALGPGALAGLSDAALALAAFDRWGEQALSRFVGPFALVVVDDWERRALLARDALGDRGLVYADLDEVVVAASEEAAVLAYPGVGDQLDEKRLAQRYAIAEPDDDATFFAAVKQVLPGHVVVIDRSGLRQRRFRSVSPRRWRGKRDLESLAARFRDLLDEAVACRMRAVARPAVLLSGGLDSGPIAALAARTASAAGSPSPLAVSWVFDAFAESDERRCIGPLLERYGLEGESVVCDDALPLSDLARWPVNPNTLNETPYRWLSERCYRRAATRGCRVVLSGVTGDDLYVGARDWLWSALLTGEVGTALLGAADCARDGGWRSMLRSAVVSPLVPGRVRRWLRPGRSAAWLTPHAASLLPTSSAWPPATVRVRREGQYAAVAGLGNSEAVAAEVYHASRCGVELRYPFRDLRLVEFALSLPSHALYSGVETRPILRAALRDLLPAEVVERRDKAEFSPLYRAAVARPAEGELFRRSLGNRAGQWRRFVDAEWVDEPMLGIRPSQVEELVRWHCVWHEVWQQRRGSWDVSKEECA